MSRGSLHPQAGPAGRLGTVGVVVAVLFAVLAARLWYLQVMASPDFAERAAAGQRREVVEPAPRGRILDRNGKVLVGNRLSKDITVDRQRLAELAEADPARRSALVERLAAGLTAVDPARPRTPADVEARLEDRRHDRLAPVPVAEDVTPEVAIWFAEHRDDFGGAVDATVTTTRTYPYGITAVHLLGYVAAIDDDELAERQGGSSGYLIGDEIGKNGVERQYEDDLRGVPGKRVIEVDSRGDPVRQLAYEAPVPGDDVILNLDVDLQATAEASLADHLARARAQPPNAVGPFPAPAGAVVLLDPRDGGVVAMASYPDYDPVEWTRPMSQARFDELNRPDGHHPLADRAVDGLYPPGSTFKLFTAVAGLRQGLVGPDTVVEDPGTYRIVGCTAAPEACVKRNAAGKVNGPVNLAQSLTVSSDVYYYGLGDRLWLDRDRLGDPIQAAARDFGLGADTGIDLPAESSGVVPDAGYKHDLYARTYPDRMDEAGWYSGDNVNLAIGQGLVQVTPLQLAGAYAAFGNGGTLHRPRVAREIRRPDGSVARTVEPSVARQIDLDPDWRQALLQGLEGATATGTAAQAFAGFPGWTVAGKTGTAQTGAGRQDDSLFVGFGPAEAPRYAAAAVLENAGFGSELAAPVVRAVLQAAAEPATAPVAQPGGALSVPPVVAEVVGAGPGGGGVD